MGNPFEGEINDLNSTKSISHLLANEEDVVVDLGFKNAVKKLEPTPDGWARCDYGEHYTILITLKRAK
ncbi:hypothetical protein CON34_05955 [Bacillus thuringiensis]|uniref:hypothetical protein n=1 Tax=Bacillus thuringiensis TaxID=1428 RepID=UPI000BEC8D85|nr:hypothetical protein [Bacillus thuringiensis]PED27303.1 hypothetical protein CON34_05955 [Bacillus thuringiensis]